MFLCIPQVLLTMVPRKRRGPRNARWSVPSLLSACKQINVDYTRQSSLTLFEPQSRFGDKPVKFQVVCPQNGTAVLKGLTILLGETICNSQILFQRSCVVTDPRGVQSMTTVETKSLWGRNVIIIREWNTTTATSWSSSVIIVRMYQSSHLVSVGIQEPIMTVNRSSRRLRTKQAASIWGELLGYCLRALSKEGQMANKWQYIYIYVYIPKAKRTNE